MEPQWTSTGHKVEVPPEIDRIPEYNKVSQNHLWIMITSYKVDPINWNRETSPVLDQENLISIVGPACFYCEKPFSQKIYHRRCSGDPDV